MSDTLTRSRWIRTTTAAGLVPLLLVTSAPACALRSDTSSMPADGWTPQAAQRQRPGGLGPRAVPAEAPPAAGTLSEWARVEAVPVGTQTVVQLHDDEAPPDSRRVTGRLHAATADTLTLTLGERTVTSSTHTVAKSAVHSVSIRRPIRKRSLGWSILVAGTAFLTASFASSGGPRTMGCGAVRRLVRRSRFTSWFLSRATATDLRGTPRGLTAHHPG